MLSIIVSCIPRRGAVIGLCAAFGAFATLCALVAAALMVSASTAHAQGLQDCGNIDNITLLNAAEAGGLEMEPPLAVRNASRGDSFTAHAMLSCKAKEIAWSVYELDTRLPVPRLDTADATDYVRGDGVQLQDDRLWDSDGAGPLAPVYAAHYEIYFSNGEKNLWPDDKKSLLPDRRYLLQLVVTPHADPSNRVKIFEITLPESVGNGIFDRLLDTVRPNNIIRAAATGVASGTQAVGCSAVGEAGGTPPNNCDENDVVAGAVGAQPVIAAVNFLSMPRKNKSECYAAGETVEIEVRFNREVMAVADTGSGAARQLRPSRWAREHLFLQLEMNNIAGSQYRYARYDGGFQSHQKGWVFKYDIDKNDQVSGQGIGIRDLVLRDDPDTGESPNNTSSPPVDGRIHAKLDPESGASAAAWFISNSIHSTGAIVFPSYAPADVDPAQCVDGSVEDKVLIKELELTTFSGMLVGTPSHLTYEREITARGWRVAMNVVYAVLIPLIIGWMGLTIIVKPLVGGQDVEWHEMIPRLILGLIAAASSYWWVRLLIDLADALSQYVGSRPERIARRPDSAVRQGGDAIRWRREHRAGQGVRRPVPHIHSLRTSHNQPVHHQNRHAEPAHNTRANRNVHVDTAAHRQLGQEVAEYVHDHPVAARPSTHGSRARDLIRQSDHTGFGRHRRGYGRRRGLPVLVAAARNRRNVSHLQIALHAGRGRRVRGPAAIHLYGDQHHRQRASRPRRTRRRRRRHSRRARRRSRLRRLLPQPARRPRRRSRRRTARSGRFGAERRHGQSPAHWTRTAGGQRPGRYADSAGFQSFQRRRQPRRRSRTGRQPINP